MGRTQGEAIGFTFMAFGAVLLIFQETGIFPKQDEWIPVATMLGGLVVGASSSWVQHANRRLPVQNPRDVHDPMQTRKGVYQW